MKATKNYMKKCPLFRPGLIAVALLLCSGAATAAEVDLAQANTLLKAGKAKECYALLAPHEYEQAGNVNYDYLLGIAALDSGKADKASLALERVLAVNPNFVGARLDLARAYFALGDLERAKTEFEAVQTQNPPPTAKTVIEQYLDAIDKKLNPGTSVTGYLEGTIGYDTNVNTATAAGQVYIPVFGASLTLDSTSLAARDNYLSLGGGVEISKPLKQGLSLFAGVDAKKRVNFFKDTYNTDSLDGRVGLNSEQGANNFRLSAQAGTYAIDDRLNRHQSSLSGEWRHTLDPRNIISVFGQYGLLRYGHDKTATDLSYNDVDQTVAGLGWLRALDDYGHDIVFASVYGGEENTVGATVRMDGDQRFLGVKLGGQKWLRDDLDAFGSIGFKEGRYLLRNPLILDYRRDYQYDLSLGLNWKPAKNWVVRPQVSYLRNDSNSGLNDYDRTDASLTVRRDFK